MVTGIGFGMTRDAPVGAIIADLLPHIVAFTLEIEAIQGKRKLSQNRAAEDRAGVIGGLRERGKDDDGAIAEAMLAYPYASPEPGKPV